MKMGPCVRCRRKSKEPSVAGVERMGDGEVEDPGYRDRGRPGHGQLEGQGEEVGCIVSEMALEGLQQNCFGRTVLPSR